MMACKRTALENNYRTIEAMNKNSRPVEGVKPIPASVLSKYATRLRPHLLERQAFTAEFSDYQPAKIVNGKVVFTADGKLVLNPPFSDYDHISRQFLLPIRQAVQSVRGFLKFPSTGRNRAFERLIDQKGRSNVFVFDHASDLLFDAEKVLAGMSATGLRLIYSIDASQVDLPQWLGALWDPQVLENPATVIGPGAVRHAKDIPAGSPILRFALKPTTYAPDVLIYCAPDRIMEVFRLAAQKANFTRQFARGLIRTGG